MKEFVPRIITKEMSAQGYNNEGKGELLGYIAVPAEHEAYCAYRITTGGDPDKQPHKSCTCRIGLWREATSSQVIVNEMRKTSKFGKKKKSKKASKPKTKIKTKSRKKVKRKKVKK